MAIFGQTRNPEWKSQFNSSKKRPFFPTMTRAKKFRLTTPKKSTRDRNKRVQQVQRLKAISVGPAMIACRCYAELPKDARDVYDKLCDLNLLYESEEDFHVTDEVYEAYIKHGMDYLVENRHLFPLVAENDPYA